MTTTTTSRRALLALALLPLLLATGCAADETPQVASLQSSAPTDDGAPDDEPAPAGAAPDRDAAPDDGTAADQGTGAAPAGDAATDADGPRPQFRLDDTDARRTALINAYNQCLLDHGATPQTGRGEAVAAAGGDGGVPYVGVADPVPADAKAACADRLPLLPPEIETATNPQFHEQSLAYITCMRDQGLWVQLLGNENLDWTYDADHPVPADSARIEQDCLLVAFQ